MMFMRSWALGILIGCELIQFCLPGQYLMYSCHCKKCLKNLLRMILLKFFYYQEFFL